MGAAGGRMGTVGMPHVHRGGGGGVMRGEGLHDQDTLSGRVV